MGARYPQRTEKNIRAPGTEITDSCELPCECWESDLDLLKEWPMLLTTEASLHFLFF